MTDEYYVFPLLKKNSVVVSKRQHNKRQHRPNGKSPAAHSHSRRMRAGADSGSCLLCVKGRYWLVQGGEAVEGGRGDTELRKLHDLQKIM